MSEVVPGTRPADLVPGEPDVVEQLAARLASLSRTIAEASARLDAVEAGAWTGEAGRMFRLAAGEVPAQLTRAAAAFASAARAVGAYGRELRESQAEAARAIRLVEQSTPETRSADQQAAARLVARARSQVEDAGRLAAERLARAADDAPAAEQATRSEGGHGITLRVVPEHRLADPEGFVAPLGEWGDKVGGMRFTSPHEVGFAGAVTAAEAGEPGWRAWASADSARQLGAVEPGVLAALGVAAVGLTMIGRPRRERTALGLVGLDEAELRQRREEFGGPRHRDGVLTPPRTARLRSPDAWRTRLATTTRPEGTVQHWTGPGVGHLPRTRATAERSGSVDRDVRGAVLRTGRPAHEGV